MKCFRCEGCGKLAVDPKAYLDDIRRKPGVISCCPETKFVEHDTGPYDLTRMGFEPALAAYRNGVANMFTWGETPQGYSYWGMQHVLEADGKNITQTAVNAINDMLLQWEAERTIHGYETHTPKYDYREYGR